MLLIFLLYFDILFPKLFHPELDLSTKVHVPLAFMEMFLQTKPNQRLPDTNNLGKMMAGKQQKQRHPPWPCLGCSLLPAGICVRVVPGAKASLPDCLSA